jgi:hypothetical protein
MSASAIGSGQCGGRESQSSGRSAGPGPLLGSEPSLSPGRSLGPGPSLGSSSPLQVVGVAGRHAEHDRTGKTDFKGFPAIGTKLSHFSGSAQSTSWSASPGGRRQKSASPMMRLARPASIASSPFASSDFESPLASSYLKLTSNADRSNADRNLSLRVAVEFGRRLARVLGLFGARMSDRVGEGGLKPPIEPAKRAGNVEWMTIVPITKSFTSPQELCGASPFPLLYPLSPSQARERCVSSATQLCFVVTHAFLLAATPWRPERRRGTPAGASASATGEGPVTSVPNDFMRTCIMHPLSLSSYPCPVT